jgi:dCMP deaminase
MRTAALWGEMSTCSRLAVGAVVAVDGRMQGTGYNGAPRGVGHCFHPQGSDESCQVAKHAEENVIANCAYNGNSTRGGILFVSYAPCYRCAGLIINSGIERVYFGQHYRDEAGIELLREVGIPTRLGDS